MGPMLVLASSLYQFYVTVGHLSSLNSLLVSLFSLCICSHQPVILVTLCVSQVVHYILGFASQIFHNTTVVFCFCPLFLSLLYIIHQFLHLLCLIYHCSILFRCLHFYFVFLYFAFLTVFTFHLFMVTSGLKYIYFITVGLKSIHVNF